MTILNQRPSSFPARNERGNIEPAVQRLPQFCDDIEIIFIEGHSKDGTFEEMERVKAAYPDKDIKLMRQSGKGKADAVFTAYDVARGDVLMILDADLTMPPEQLPKFWDAIKSGKGEFITDRDWSIRWRKTRCAFSIWSPTRLSHICSRGC